VAAEHRGAEAEDNRNMVETIMIDRGKSGINLFFIIRWALLCLILIALAVWATLAVYYSNLPEGLRMPGAIAVALLFPGIFLMVHPARSAVAAFCGVWLILLAWWLFIPPSNQRNWQPDVAVLPWAEISGNQVTIHNIRNCEYRSETDYTVRHYDKTYDLNQLRRVDLFLVYWGSPSIAHTMLSFGFDGGVHVCFSIETRKRIGQEYSAIKGFFKQYELTYVVADERDLVGLRTNYRNEDVYLYRLIASAEVIRGVFLDYLKTVTRLKDKPEWYNALTSNCTTNIRGHTHPYNPDGKWDWRIIINGYVDEMCYERGVIDQNLPFDELKKKSYINPQARSGEIDSTFSRRIRNGMPGM
jgi:hypothetical protein